VSIFEDPHDCLLGSDEIYRYRGHGATIGKIVALMPKECRAIVECAQGETFVYLCRYPEHPCIGYQHVLLEKMIDHQLRFDADPNLRRKTLQLLAPDKSSRREIEIFQSDCSHEIACSELVVSSEAITRIVDDKTWILQLDLFRESAKRLTVNQRTQLYSASTCGLARQAIVEHGVDERMLSNIWENDPHSGTAFAALRQIPDNDPSLIDLLKVAKNEFLFNAISAKIDDPGLFANVDFGSSQWRTSIDSYIGYLITRRYGKRRDQP